MQDKTIRFLLRMVKKDNQKILSTGKMFPTFLLERVQRCLLGATSMGKNVDGWPPGMSQTHAKTREDVRYNPQQPMLYLSNLIK